VEALEELVAVFGARVRIGVPRLLFEQQRRFREEQLGGCFE